MSIKIKKQSQLGINPSTANGRLRKDLLWKYICLAGHNTCCKCNKEMTAEDFSIEHIVPWLDSENPTELYFDLDNISFSHLNCNIADRRVYKLTEHGEPTRYFKNDCRCELCTKAANEYKKKYYTPEKRSARYQRTGN